MTANPVMAWILLACAILTEIAATTALKYTNGLNIFTHTFLTLSVVILYISSYVCMAQALKLQLEVSVAYAMWSGIGTAAIAVIGAMFFRESVHPVKIGGIALIVVGVAMLNLGASSSSHASGHGEAVRPATNVALAQAMTGLTVVVGRHRAPVGASYRLGDPDRERHRPRHARPAWGQRTAPGAALPGGHVTADHPGRHAHRRRVPDHATPAHHVPRGPAHQSPARYTPGSYGLGHRTPGHRVPGHAPGRRTSAADAPGHHTPGAVRGDAPVPVAAALPAPAGAHPAAYPVPAAHPAEPALPNGADLAPDRAADIVVEPAAVEPPAAFDRPRTPMPPIPAHRRAPIKGVTLLHPYPDHPVTTRSA